MSKKIFISWSGRTGQKLSLAMKEHLLNYPGLNPWISSEDIQTGQVWFNKITESLNEVDEALVILTPSTLNSPWLNFEAGFLFGKLRRLSIVIISNDHSFKVTGPFFHFQAFDGRDKNDIINYITSITNELKKNVERWVETFFNDWLNSVERIFANENPIENTISNFHNLFQLDTNKIVSNPVYCTLVNNYLKESSFTITGLETKFQILAENYPYFILELQEKLNVRTKSIALHNHFERFWSTPLGNAIRHTASHTSERIFVYNTEQELEYDFTNLMQHSKDYSVYILSYETLSSRFPDYAKDFAIISSESHSIHAEYNLSKHKKTIDFTINDQITKRHEDNFNTIVRISIPFDSKYDISNFEEIKRRVFDYPKDYSKAKLSHYEKRTVEMSKNINIYDYDGHEEEHAYYIAMLDCMLSKIKLDFPIRILEVGAGTGLLTKRLAQLNTSELIGIEYDWNCFKRLQHNLKHYKHVKLLYEDSRIYNPEGKFDIVISSFSDHHIKPQDKFSYFSNIKDNLKDNGLFIVGDEFLRDYDETNKVDYIAALEDYHNHIIKIAESKNQDILVSLEKDALFSGINELGDFKVSNSIYEKCLEEVNLSFSKELIGPLDIQNIGGIYVYTIHK
jgi:SAM-dependent methyltransferase